MAIPCQQCVDLATSAYHDLRFCMPPWVAKMANVYDPLDHKPMVCGIQPNHEMTDILESGTRIVATEERKADGGPYTKQPEYRR